MNTGMQAPDTERDELSALLNRINRESEILDGPPLLSTWDFADRILSSDWLRARDAEVKALALEEFADLQDAVTQLHSYAMDDDDWDEHKRVTACLRNRAAQLRAENG